MKRTVFPAALALILAGLPIGARPTASDTIADTIAVTAKPIPLYPDRAKDKAAGQLIYRGGIELSSQDTRFGGLSDIAINEDGSEILVVADVAYWFRAKLHYAPDGTLNGLSNASLASMRDLEGNILHGKDGDAEGMTLVQDHNPNGAVLVSFEGIHRVWQYDMGQGFAAIPKSVPMGDWIQGLNGNEGLEGITLLPRNRLLAVSEHTVSSTGDIVAGIESYPPGQAQAVDLGPLVTAPHGNFWVTSTAHDADGSIFMLERSFSPFDGASMELRHLKADDIHPGARLEGDVLAQLSGNDSSIDNMEGLAIRHDAKGKTYLYMISDDNFSPLQKTVLLMFELKK